MGLFSKLKEGLTKTRDNIVSGIDSVFSGFSSIDDDFYEELEETLIMGDMGITATEEVMEELRRQVKERHVKETEDCRELLKESIEEQMQVPEDAYDFENQQSVIMVIGVNGVGKTTSVGKLAAIYKKQGKRVLIAAADTFRAAAGEQLDEWAKRAGVEIISGAQGADPSSVIFDAVNAEITTLGRADLVDVDDSNIGLNGSPTKIARASDKVKKGQGEMAPEDADPVSYIVGKLKDKHVI